MVVFCHWTFFLNFLTKKADEKKGASSFHITLKYKNEYAKNQIKTINYFQIKIISCCKNAERFLFWIIFWRQDIVLRDVDPFELV